MATTATVVIMRHSYYDADHLAEVVEEMRTMGAPTLRAVEIDGEIYLLEGCHRVRAAVELGLPVTLEMLEYDPETDGDTLPEDFADGIQGSEATMAECIAAPLHGRDIDIEVTI